MVSSSANNLCRSACASTRTSSPVPPGGHATSSAPAVAETAFAARWTSSENTAFFRAVHSLAARRNNPSTTWSPKLATTSDHKHQSAPNQHGHQVEHSTQRVRGGAELRNARKLDQNDVEVARPGAPSHLRAPPRPSTQRGRTAFPSRGRPRTQGRRQRRSPKRRPARLHGTGGIQGAGFQKPLQWPTRAWSKTCRRQMAGL